ncbi:MAG TPA: Gmad2 immunoglobulin-like domain-containing protein [Micromonosporaceae bacterium]
MSFASLATGTVASVTAVVMGVASCVPDPDRPAATTGPPAITGAAPSTTPSGVVVASSIPVYFTAEVDQRTMLYREYHLAVGADSLPARIAAALSVMMANQALDPDYGGVWPGGSTVRDVRIEGSVAVVDLAGVQAATVSRAAAQAAVQQLVFTVTAVAADRGTQLSGVRLLVDGERVGRLWGQVSVGELLTRGPALDFLAPVWIISPQHQETVGRTFEVHLAGAVFEATMRLRVRDRGGNVVLSRSVMLSIGAPQRGEATVSLTLAPGLYTVEAFEVSARDGREQFLDDHTIEVAG